MNKVYIITAEHESYGGGGDPYAILGVYEDEGEARKFYADLGQGKAGQDYEWLGNWTAAEPAGQAYSDMQWWINFETWPVIRKGGKVPALPTGSGVSSADIKLINRHRRLLGMGDIDPASGWTDAELQDMAQSIRQHGRLPNPKYSQDELSKRGGAAGRSFLGSWGGGIVGAVVAGPAGSALGRTAGGYYGVSKTWKPAGIEGKGQLAQSQRERLASAALGGAIGGLLLGPLGAALGAYIGAGKAPTARNPYAYSEYRHLTDDEREHLLNLILKAQEANVQMAMARTRGDMRLARKYEAKHQEAMEKLMQLEERLAVSRRGTGRPGRKRRA